MKLALFVLTVLVALCSCVRAEQSATMKFIVIQDVEVVKAEAGFNPGPMLALVADQHFRFEALTTEGTLAYIVIRNHDDLWRIDSPSLQTTHWKDYDSLRLCHFVPPEPTLALQLPVGGEREFFTQHHAVRGEDELLDSTWCEVWVLDSAGVTLRLWIDQRTELPKQVHLQSPYSDYKVLFLMYRELAFDQDFFLPQIPKEKQGAFQHLFPEAKEEDRPLER